jgi:DNA repair protein RadC
MKKTAYKPIAKKRYALLRDMPVTAVGEVQLGWLRHNQEQELMPCQVKSSEDLNAYFLKRMDHHLDLHECMYALYLNRKNFVMGVPLIGQGNVSATVCNLQATLQAAILLNCSAVALAHNHPSGSTRPSEDDIKLTKKTKAAFQQMDISMLDQVIITRDNGYYSFADEGLV